MTTSSVSIPAAGRTSLTGRAVVVACIGLVCGAATVLNHLAPLATADPPFVPSLGQLLGYMLAGGVLAAGVLIIVDRVALALVASLPADVRARLGVYEPFTFLPALLPLLGIFGVYFPPAVVTLLLIISARGAAVLAAMSPAQRSQAFASTGYLAFLFLISGFAALIYQIVWQRTLFTALGVNIESITIIVALFMFGLGIGAFAGGLLSRRFPGQAPMLFFACQLGIGLFGVVSLPLIGMVSRAVLHGSLLTIALAVFALLCIPTLLMGATLPILVTHLNRHLRSVGHSVGLLYFINTVGSAIACFLTADLLFVLFGQRASVMIAAGCNLLVGLLVFRFARRVQAAEAPAAPSPALTAAAASETSPRGGSMSHRVFVLFFAAAVGYISLSQEMVWMRVVSYMTGGRPSVFAYVLGFFLLGVAGGAYLAERLCKRYFAGNRSPVSFIAAMLFISAIVYYLSITATGALFDRFAPAGLAAAHLAVAAIAFSLGGIFPILCHYGARAGRSVGLAVSLLYLANIVGCVLGPLLTGFVLMEYFSTSQIILGLSIATAGLGGLALLFAPGRWLAAMLATAGIVAAMMLAYGPLYGSILEKLHFHRDWPFKPYNFLLENRHGIVSTVASPRGDIIYGGGVYDGTFNTCPVVDSNWITRCYMVAALHPGPRQVLEIGLSSGSWTRVLADYAPLDKLTVVEINPGYLDVIARHPEQASVLTDPKVEIHFDDGRRWLNRNPGRKFDVIVQNTTWHWRSQSTNLLSADYFELCKSHLNDGGVIYCNTTRNDDIKLTAAEVFKHVVVYGNFVAASDRPFDMTTQQRRENLLRFASFGRQVFDQADPRRAEVLDRLAAWPLNDLAEEFRANKRLWVITDDNMAVEYKLARLYNRNWTWLHYLSALRQHWAKDQMLHAGPR